MVSTLSKTTSPDDRGSGRVSPGQMFDAGYRDGWNGTRNYKLYLKNNDYSDGWIRGRRSNPASPWYNPTNLQATWTEGYQVAAQLAD